MSTLKLLKEIRESGDKTPYATLLRSARKYQDGGTKLPALPTLQQFNPVQDVTNTAPVINPIESQAIAKQAYDARVRERESSLAEHYNQSGMISGMRRKPTESEIKYKAEKSVDYNTKLADDPLGTLGPDLVMALVPEMLMLKGTQQVIGKGLQRINPFKIRPNSSTKLAVSSVDDVSKGFKSEIDWAKWNKEIPENKALMQEYNAIEKQAKANGTWMKNPDGSVFKGTPEQFIQQQSSNFKKAFPEGFDKTYRGDSNHFLEFKKDRGIYTTGKVENASHYTTANNPGFWNPEKHSIGQNVKFTMPESSEEINRLAREASKTGDYSKVNEYRFNKIVNSDSGGLRELYSPKSKNSFTIDAKGKEWTNVPFEGKEMPTDFISEEVFNKNLDYINIKNVRDPHLDNLKIINPNRVNIKSALGNNGMFDMTNPNIYKGLIPLVGTTTLLNSNKNN